MAAKSIQKKNTNIITIRIVDEIEMKYLNLRYRGQNKTTNILSFSLNQLIKNKYTILGDLVLCNKVIEYESLKYNKKLKSHWAHITIHGALHLLGYNHKNQKDAYIMEKLENHIMVSLNYDKPYSL